jgi:integrase
VRPAERRATGASVAGSTPEDRSYRELLRHATEILGSTALRDVTGYDLDRLRDRKLAAGLNPQSVSLIRAAVRRCLNDAVRRKLIAANPVGDSKKPLVMRHKVEPMPPERARAILDAVKGDTYGPIFSVAIGTGLRRGELLGLRWSDVDLSARSITVRQALLNLRGQSQPTFAKPKTRDSEARVVDMPPFVVDALREHRARQLEARLLVGPAWRDLDLVFAGATGLPLDAGHVTTRLHRLLAPLGLGHVRLHDLRHAFASLSLAAGVELAVVSKNLGHSTLAITSDYYLHLIPAQKRDAAERLGAYLGTGS